MLQMTKQAIAKLQQETNHSLTVDDLDIIAELEDCAKGFAGVSKKEARILRQPHELCGILFYPLTVAKSLWFAEKAEEWDISEIQQEGLLFWLLSLPNEGDILDEYSDPKVCDKAVKKLSRRLHCTSDEINSVYRKCVGRSDEPGGGESKDPDYGGMIAILLNEYGGTPDQWLYETPMEVIGDLFRARVEKMEAEHNAEKQASAKHGKAIAPRPSKKLQAMAHFRRKVNEIRELWREDGE